MRWLVLRFCLLGSFLAGGTFATVRDIWADGSRLFSEAVLYALWGVPFWSVMASFMSIPIGFVPALVATVGYWLYLHTRTHVNPPAWIRAGVGALVGGLAAGFFGGIMFSVETGPGHNSVMANFSSWLIAGCVGGAASALSARNKTYEKVFPKRSGVVGA